VRHGSVKSAKINPCPFCDRTYEAKWRLEKHMKLSHGGELVASEADSLKSCNVVNTHRVVETSLKQSLDVSCELNQPFKEDVDYEVKLSLVHGLTNGENQNITDENTWDNEAYIKNNIAVGVSAKSSLEQNYMQMKGKRDKSASNNRWLRSVPSQVDVPLQNARRGYRAEHPTLPDWCNSGPPHTCHLCIRSFTTKSHLIFHVRRTHADELGAVLFPCHICDRSCVSQTLLDKHVMLHNATAELGGPFRCDKCTRVYTTQASLHTHVRLRHLCVDTVYSCPSCVKTYVRQWRLDRHQRLVHSEAVKMGGVAKKEERSVFNIKKEEMSEFQTVPDHAPSPQHPCSSCTKSFGTKSHRAFHIRQVHPEVLGNSAELFACVLCSRSFVAQSRLDKHMTLHTMHAEAGSPFQCPLCKCTRLYATRKNLDAHVRARHSCTDVIYSCTVCPRTYVTQWRLDRHVRHAHNGKEGDSVSRGNVRGAHKIEGRDIGETNHVAIETDIHAPYVCCDCFARFRTKDAFLRHHVECHDIGSVDMSTDDDTLLTLVKSRDTLLVKEEEPMGTLDMSTCTFTCDVCLRIFPSQV